MVLNVKLSEEVAVKLGATASVTLEAPDILSEQVLGRAAFQDVEAVITPTGLIMAFELEPDELLAIKRGQTQFLMHVYSQTGIIPFRMIFERAEFSPNGQANGGQEPQNQENTDSGLPDSEPG